MEPIAIEALVVRTPDALVRVMLGEHCLDFHPDDVLDLEELPSPGALIPGSAVFARISVRAGAPLMRISSAQAYEPLLWARRQPFFLATRPAHQHCDNDDIAEKEQAFFHMRGIDVAIQAGSQSRRDLVGARP